MTMSKMVDENWLVWESPRDIWLHTIEIVGQTIESYQPDSTLNPGLPIGKVNKGGFGTLLESAYFRISPENTSTPDFEKANLELKSTPVIQKKGAIVAKERLALNMINYLAEHSVSFLESSFIKKNRRILIVSYLHEPNQAVEKLIIHNATLFIFDQLPTADKRLIIEDWCVIQSKINRGLAHLLSESDTKLLKACTKSENSKSRRQQKDGPDAKPRAYSFKQSYLTSLIAIDCKQVDCESIPTSGDNWQIDSSLCELVDEISKSGTIKYEDVVLSELMKFSNQTAQELFARFKINSKSKQAYRSLVKAMLGGKIREAELLDAADIEIKTMRISSKGKPKESMSFKNFDFNKIVSEEWFDEDNEIQASFREEITKRFLFIVFACSKNCKDGDVVFFKTAFFWNASSEDLAEIEKGWKATQTGVRTSNAKLFPKSTNNNVMHVRPKARNNQDTDTFPDGTKITRQCFWLNKRFLCKILSDQNVLTESSKS